MALSQNGRVVLEQYGGPLVVTLIPGTTCKYLGGLLPGDVNTIAMYWGHRWNTEIEPLQQDHGLWGYNLRNVRGSSTSISNHSSGTAWDTMAVNHPLGQASTFNAKQLAALTRMVTDLRGAVRSGQFYSGRKDGMHCECVGSDQLLSEVASLIRAGQLPNTHPSLITNPSKPRPNKPASPTKPKEWYEMPLPDDVKAELAKLVHDETLKVLRQEGVGLTPHALEDVRAVAAAAAQTAGVDVIRHEGVGLTEQALNSIADAVVARLGK